MKYISQSVLLVLGLFLLIYLALVLVFLIEKLDFLLHAAINYNMHLGGFMLLLATYMPLVADFILPVAALVSVYLVLVYKRENREFLILAAAGIGMRPTVAITMILGGFFAATSLYVSGYLKPLASDLYFSEFQRAIDSAVISGWDSGQFVVEDDAVFHVGGLKDHGVRDLQIFEFDHGSLSQILLSGCAKLVIQGGEVFASLCNLEIRRFGGPGESAETGSADQAEPRVPCRICPNASGDLNVDTLRADDSSINTKIGTFAKAAGDTGEKSRVLHEMLETDNGLFVSRSDARNAAGAVMMALSCLLAVAIAVFGAAKTNAGTRFAVLPSSIAIATMLNVVASAGLLVPEAALSPVGFTVFFSLASIAALLSIPLSIGLAGRSLLAPALART